MFHFLYFHLINPFVPNAPFLYPLKTSENRKLFLFSGGTERVHWKQMGLKKNNIEDHKRSTKSVQISVILLTKNCIRDK